jgi:hypothetical protein
MASHEQRYSALISMGALPIQLNGLRLRYWTVLTAPPDQAMNQSERRGREKVVGGASCWPNVSRFLASKSKLYAPPESNYSRENRVHA